MFMVVSVFVFLVLLFVWPAKILLSNGSSYIHLTLDIRQTCILHF